MSPPLPAAPKPEAVGKLPPVDSLKAVLFDVDGTLALSDPLHYVAFREILVEVGFQGGVPIDEEFYRKHISGRHNPDIGADLFPDWPASKRDKLLDDKEARFRAVAATTLKPVKGLLGMCDWISQRVVRRVAVTNAPRANAEQMIASLGLTEFFEHLIIGSECERAKPFPEPYLKGLELLGVEASHAFAFEDSPSGITSAVRAGLPVVAVTTGQEPRALWNAGATLVVEDFEDAALWEALR